MAETYPDLTGDGVVTFSAGGNVGLVGINVTTVPDYVSILSAGTPRRVNGIGWIALQFPDDPEFGTGELVFSAPVVWIDFEQQAVWPAKLGIYGDRLAYHFEPGAVVTLYMNFA